MTAFNSKADLDKLDITRFNSYGKGWIDVPISRRQIRGNGAILSADSTDITDFKTNVLTNSGFDLLKFKLDAKSITGTIDGFFALQSSIKDKKQLYLAYSYANNIFQMFSCVQEGDKKDCKEFGKSFTFDAG